jgi:hypothetical protein
MQRSIERSYIGPRDVRPLVMATEDVSEFAALDSMGINFSPANLAVMAEAHGMDSQALITTASIAAPIQFLQTWLPGFVRTITAARKIDELLGISTVGNWEDEEVVQGVLEPIGNAVPYGDYTNVPLASWNTEFQRRTVVRFEKGLLVGKLEEARAARMKVNSSAEKRGAVAIALEIQRNAIGFFGYNSGAGRTYGFLNDPYLPAYYSVPNGAGGTSPWSGKSFLEITSDIRTAFATLQTQSQDTISMESEMTLAIPTASAAYLTVTSSLGTSSVAQWIKETFPKMRVVSAPQLNAANGGANVFYLYAESVDDGASDDSRTFVQVVPAKLISTGVENRAKGYVEDYTNATAGVILKRPYAVVRGSGI